MESDPLQMSKTDLVFEQSTSWLVASVLTTRQADRYHKSRKGRSIYFKTLSLFPTFRWFSTHLIFQHFTVHFYIFSEREPANSNNTLTATITTMIMRKICIIQPTFYMKVFPPPHHFLRNKVSSKNQHCNKNKWSAVNRRRAKLPMYIVLSDTEMNTISGKWLNQ